jgi:predicted dehydrogenase
VAAETLRVAVVGLGFGARVQLPVFSEHPQTTVTAVCSGTLERAKATAAQFSIPHYSDDFRECVKRADVDLVSIVTPPHLHMPIVLAALKAGKDVLCEKPFALSVAQAQRMVAAAKRARRVGMLDHEFRYIPARMRAKGLVDDGWLGTVERIVIVEAMPWMHAASTLRHGWQSRAETGGGVLGALGSHYIDYCRWLAGDVREVKATLQTRVRKRAKSEGGTAPVDADDNFALTLEMAGGTLASINLTATASTEFFSSIFISGSKGALHIRDDKEIFGLRAGRDPVTVTAPGRFPRRLAAGHRLSGPFYTLVTEMLAHLAGKPSSVPTFDDGLKVQEVLDAARRSAKTGRAIRLATPRRRA